MEYEQDIFDLNDFCLVENRQLFESIRYLSESTRYDILNKFWISKGSPCLEDYFNEND